MIAKIKNVEAGSFVEDGGEKFYFLDEMTEFIGKQIPLQRFSGNWFMSKNDFWIYHISWLE